MAKIEIDCVQIYYYHLPFVTSYWSGDKQFDEREGVLIELIDRDGHSGWGEVSPMPHFSAETLKKALHELGELKDFLRTYTVETDPQALIVALRDEPRLKGRCSSVRCGIEMAILNLVAAGQHTSLISILGDEDFEVEINGLLSGSVEEVVARTRQLISYGYTTFKLKVGNRNIPLEVKKVQALRELMNNEMILRLDANRTWSYTEAILFSKMVGSDKIQYIEEPFNDLSLIPKFYRETGIPVGLDESLRDHGVDQLSTIEGVGAFIIKPMIVGGMIQSLLWMETALQLGISSVISSTFETGIALTAYANLSVATQEPAGLGTLRYFKEDVLDYPLVNEQGLITEDRLKLRSHHIKKHLINVIE